MRPVAPLQDLTGELGCLPLRAGLVRQLDRSDGLWETPKPKARRSPSLISNASRGSSV